MRAGEVAIPRPEPEYTVTEPKSVRFGETLKHQFRQLMERLTRPAAPKPRIRRRRTGDTRGGFRLAALSLVRRTLQAAHIPPAIWDTLTWLRHWEFDDRVTTDELYQASVRSESTHEYVDLSPRP
jgi:hypothetical protein